jgi:hypothetical protein
MRRRGQLGEKDHSPDSFDKTPRWRLEAGMSTSPLRGTPIHRADRHAANIPADYRVMFESDHDGVLAYELQGRYASGEEWITLDVCNSRMVAVEEALLHRDPWGRAPTEFRVVALFAGHRRRRPNR